MLAHALDDRSFRVSDVLAEDVHHDQKPLTAAVSRLTKDAAAADGRFVFTISTRETCHWALNLVSSARAHGMVVGVLTYDQGLCDELRLLGVKCASANIPALVALGSGGCGYAMTYAKFDVMRLAIELGFAPTFIDADVVVTANLRAALDQMTSHDLYLANGKGPR